MATVGEILKDSREAQGITLEEVAAATRIQIRFLKMLEDNDLGTMPEESYFLGFISSYASFVGLDSKELCQKFIQHYKDARKPPKPAKKPESVAAPVPPFSVSAPLTTVPPTTTTAPEPPPISSAAEVKEEPKTESSEKTSPPSVSSTQPIEESPRQLKFYFLGIIILLVILFFSYPALKHAFWGEGKNPSPPSPTVQTPAPTVAPVPSPPAPQPKTSPSPVPAKIAAPAKTAAAPSPPKTEPSKAATPKIESPATPAPVFMTSKPSPTTTKGPLHLEARATQDCWIGLRIDGAPQRVEFTMKQGQRISWEAKEKFLLSVGNAGGVELFLNGVSLGKLGEPGQVRTDISITKEGRR